MRLALGVSYPATVMMLAFLVDIRMVRRIDRLGDRTGLAELSVVLSFLFFVPCHASQFLTMVEDTSKIFFVIWSYHSFRIPPELMSSTRQMNRPQIHGGHRPVNASMMIRTSATTMRTRGTETLTISGTPLVWEAELVPRCCLVDLHGHSQQESPADRHQDYDHYRRHGGHHHHLHVQRGTTVDHQVPPPVRDPGQGP